MRALVVSGFDRPPQLEDVSPPVPGPGEVALRIHACGLNFADLLMCEGRYQDIPPLPFTPGLEVCGTVTELGPGTDGPAPGTRVAAFGAGGGLAEAGVFPARLCRPLPQEMPDEIAAGFQVAYGTSQLALTRRARLCAGETLLVLGAAGGVGLTAVEIGHRLGARVIAVARGEGRQALARAAGADHTLDPADDLKAAVRALGGADVVYDPVGGAGFTAALGALRPEGRILAIGFASGEVPQVPANLLLVKNAEVIGFYWGGYLKFAPEALGDSLGTLIDWYRDGQLRPHVGHVLPLSQAAEGLALLRERKATGKIVIRP
ncbi:MAG: NADPH:quinone oxidoreductase family protein [Rubellimicrobium sp.]|nr:NADPH:quinone oxidoreductase family protein [Rubellimicrobium sp.]